MIWRYLSDSAAAVLQKELVEREVQRMKSEGRSVDDVDILTV